MNYNRLVEEINKKRSFLCVGLDSDIQKIPQHLLKYDYPIFEFNKRIVDATAKYVIAYKPNIAFYESEGIIGWQTLEKTVDYIKTNYPTIFLIADAKRGDIGNTSMLYAKAFFETMNFDAVTIAPYMGQDSVMPFLSYEDKWAILLALTSNNGASDFQFFAENGQCLFEKVLEKSKEWGNPQNLMYVVGATRAEQLQEIRKIVPENFLLIPGVGAQGGSLADVVKYGMTKNCGLIVNSSRGIIFADSSENFAEVAEQKALELQQEMASYL